MLILTRKIGETIRIGNDIHINVCRIKGNQIALGIAAPKEVNIVREELLTRGRQAAMAER